jgi:hypothetical protein
MGGDRRPITSTPNTAASRRIPARCLRWLTPARRATSRIDSPPKPASAINSALASSTRIRKSTLIPSRLT